MKISKDTAEKLLKNGHISNDVYQKYFCGGGGDVKMADGGEVDGSGSEETPAPQTATPEINQTLAEATQKATEVPPSTPEQQTENAVAAEAERIKQSDPRSTMAPAFPGQYPSDDQYKSQAMDSIIAKKDADEKAIAQKYQTDVAGTEADNARRAKLGLPLNPVPPPPDGIVPASATVGAGGIRPASEMQIAPPGSLPTDKSATGANGQSQYFNDMMKMLGSGYDKEKAGVAMAADAGRKEAAQNAGYYQQALDTAKTMEAGRQLNESDRQKKIQDLHGQLDDLTKDYNDKAKIDPKRIFSNMDGWQKMRFVIGAALAGKTAGDTINKMIDRDIDAQKNDISNIGRKIDAKRNLISDMRSEFSDQRQAETAARSIMLDNVKLQIAQTAEKYKDPIIRANAISQIGQIENQQNALKLQMAQQLMYSPAAVGADASLQRVLIGAKSMGVKPEDALKEYGEHQKIQNTMNNIDDAYAKAGKLQTISSRIGSPLQSSRQIDNINAQITTQVMDMSPTKRLTPESYKAEIEPFLIKMGDDEETQLRKREALKKLAEQNATPRPIMSALGMIPKALNLKRND